MYGSGFNIQLQVLQQYYINHNKTKKRQQSMLSSRKHSKSMEEYLQIKESTEMPLKAKLYFAMMQNRVEKKCGQNVPQKLLKIFELLLSAFQKQTHQEKCQFLKANTIFLKEYLNRDATKQQTSAPLFPISQIETSCNMLSKYMGISYRYKTHFKLQKDIMKVKLTSKDKDYLIDLRVYLSRKSNKYRNCIVFQAISQEVKDSDRRFVIEFRDGAIFTEVYSHVRNCIIHHANQQLITLINEKSQDKLDTYAQVLDKGLEILTSKKINQYFNYKEKRIGQLQQKKFVKISTAPQTIFSVLKIKNQKCPVYRLERYFNLPLQEVKRRAVVFNRKPSGNLIHFENVQTFNQNIELGYFKYEILNKEHQFLAIIEDNVRQNEQTTILRGVDSIMINQSIDFITVKAQKKGPSTTHLTITGFIHIKGIQNSLLNNFFFKDICDLERKHNSSIVDKDQEGFVSVRGQFADEQMDFEEIQHAGLERPAPNNENTICFNSEGIEMNLSEINADMQSRIFRQEVISEILQLPQEKKTQRNSDKTTESDEKTQDRHLKYKCLMSPTPPTQKRELLDSYYLKDQWVRAKNGGLTWVNKEAIDEQKKIFRRVVSQMGENLMQGKSIINICLPVQIFRKESHLKTLARNFSYAPLLMEDLEKANPLERMKKIVTFQISRQIMGICMDKPFNPILGQTYQGHIDGCPLFLEQLSHHPPVSCYHFEGRGYKMHGSIEPKAQLGFNTVKGCSQDPEFVTFEDGTTIEHRSSPLMFKGVIFGSRQFHFDGKAYAFDEKNDIFAEIVFGQRNISFLGSSADPFDLVYGQIVKVKSGFIQSFKSSGRKIYPKKNNIESVLGTFEGIWSQAITFKGQNKLQQQLINFCKNVPCKLLDEESALPSDGSYRSDLKHFIEGDMNLSQLQKNKLQEIQRKDRKLREKHIKK